MKKARLFIVMLCVLSLLTSVFPAMASEINPEVVTTGGKIRGFMNDDTYTFLGVQYAQAERFGLPQEVSWEGTRLAQSYGTVAPLNLDNKIWPDDVAWPHRYWKYDEVCQYMNVWTQSLDADAKQPIIFWIHGGGFSTGSSIEGIDYDGKNLSNYGDAVVVTMNHRLNTLGYLDLSEFGEEYKDTANLGMLDIVAALRWIKANAESFGGDPDNITIFGQSGGGYKVLTLLRMPEAEGLFQHAVAISGTYYGDPNAENFQGYTNIKAAGDGTSKAIVEKTLAKLGFEDVAQLKDVNYDVLIDAADAAVSEAAAEGFANTGWGPTSDNVHVLDNICDWAKDVDLMVGGTFSEFKWNFTNPDDCVNDWDEAETKARLEAAFGENAETVAEEFAKVYPDKGVGDAVYYKAGIRLAVEATAEWWEKNANKPAYTYTYVYEYPFNGGTIAFHCLDLHMWFNNLDLPEIKVLYTGAEEEAYACQKSVADAFLNFARTGNPSTEALEWKPYTEAEPYTMVLDVNSECRIMGDELLNELTFDGGVL